ncbi:transmembrane protein, putative (macronuclear) [Tetrahymena thermophila SB210]|uniref:Transmembrane protein, putative n=1 Tax=Tetrahymena thermophila (strain SB210) TaxID=312017 RepID=A4VEC6_TETTS|nr:transmembrane protein, putative [Tetrahymena thermophila SB210]EDK31883.1 transmembrane protein, putative [Tetrahymena thermophila SB210]|eukprot:XP_001471231.1 transmembrane protein, putative [Tetrahymena thermophila SB210]
MFKIVFNQQLKYIFIYQFIYLLQSKILLDIYDQFYFLVFIKITPPLALLTRAFLYFNHILIFTRNLFIQAQICLLLIRYRQLIQQGLNSFAICLLVWFISVLFLNIRNLSNNNAELDQLFINADFSWLGLLKCIFYVRLYQKILLLERRLWQFTMKVCQEILMKKKRMSALVINFINHKFCKFKIWKRNSEYYLMFHHLSSLRLI